MTKSTKPKLVKQKGSTRGNVTAEITELVGRPVKKRSGRQRAVDQVLPGTEEGLPKISDALKKLLPQVDEAIYEATTWKVTETDFKKTIQQLMAEEGINEVALPRGGKLKYKPGHPSLTYIAPKKEGSRRGQQIG